MTIPIYNPDAVCPKCGYPTTQMPRKYFEKTHDNMVENEVVKCKIKGEHLHFECACGYDLIFKPLEQEFIKPKRKGKKS